LNVEDKSIFEAQKLTWTAGIALKVKGLLDNIAFTDGPIDKNVSQISFVSFNLPFTYCDRVRDTPAGGTTHVAKKSFRNFFLGRRMPLVADIWQGLAHRSRHKWLHLDMQW
jgi:hypothetical protein